MPPQWSATTQAKVSFLNGFNEAISVASLEEREKNGKKGVKQYLCLSEASFKYCSLSQSFLALEMSATSSLLLRFL